MLTLAKYNAIRRRHAQPIVKEVCALLGITKQPVFDRVSRRRGYSNRLRFSVPLWATIDEDYFTHYVIHETLHSLSKTDGHCKLFRLAEEVINRHFGFELIYATIKPNEDEPYPVEIWRNDKLVFTRTLAQKYSAKADKLRRLLGC